MPAPTLWFFIFGIVADGITKSQLIKEPINPELIELTCKLTEVDVDLESVMLRSLLESGVDIDKTANALLSISTNEGKSTSDVIFDFRPVHFGPNAAFYMAPEVSKPSIQKELRSLMTELFAGHQKPSVRFDTLGHLIHADFSLARLERLFQSCSLKSKFGNGQDAISCWRNAQNVALELQRMSRKKKHSANTDVSVDLVDANESTQHDQYLYLKQPYLCAKERDNRLNFVFAPTENFSYFLKSLAELYADYKEAGDDSTAWWLRKHTNPTLIWLITVEQCLDTKANVLDPIYVILLNRYFAARSPKIAEELAGLFITSLSSVMKSPDMRVASTVADAAKMLKVILEIPEEDDTDDATFLKKNALQILRMPQLQMLWLALDAGYERVTRTRLLMTLNDLYICLILDSAQTRLHDSGTIVANGALWCSISPGQMVIDAKDARLASIDSVDLSIANAAKQIYRAAGGGGR